VVSLVASYSKTTYAYKRTHTRFIEGIKGHLTVIMSYVLSASEQN